MRHAFFRPSSARTGLSGPRTARFWVAFIVAGAIASAAGAAAGGRVTTERLNMIGVPLMTEAPVIDGAVEVREWIGAAQSAAFVSQRDGLASATRTEVLLGYTSDEFFVAFKCHREKAWGRPRIGQDTGRDGSVWRDDRVEMYIVPWWSKNKKNAINFTGNATGVIGDGLGPSPTDKKRDWNWRYKARVTDLGWEGEVAIKFSDLGIEPPGPGVEWRFDLVRAQATPGEIVSYLSYRGRWHNLRSYSRLTFVGATPAVRVLRIGALVEDRAGLMAEIVNMTAEAQDVSVAYELLERKRDPNGLAFFLKADGEKNAVAKDLTKVLADYEVVKKVSFTRTVAANSRLPLDLSVKGFGNYALAWRVSDGEDRTLRRVMFPFLRPLPLDLEVTPYYVRPKVIFVKLAAATDSAVKGVSTVRHRITQNGKAVASRTASLEEALKGIDVSVAKLKEGAYVLEAHTLNAAGKEQSTVRKRLSRPPLPWWVTDRHGLKPFVPRPWTPVKADGKTVSVLYRTYHFDSSPLPAQMEALGEELFARAPRILLREGGKQSAFAGRLRRVTANDEAAEYVWSGKAGAFEASARILVEYDGLVTMDFEIKPNGRMIEALTVEFPLRGEMARLYTRNMPFRPFKKSEKFASPAGEVTGLLQMPANCAVWVGTTERGFQWCTESDEHWRVKDKRSAIDIEPMKDGSVVLRLRVIERPFKPEGIVRYRWGLNATPTRGPLPELAHKLRSMQFGTTPRGSRTRRRPRSS